MNYADLFRECYYIRIFEKTVEKRFEAGLMRGTTHGCIGQEIIYPMIFAHVDKLRDYITGTHRCHGQILAYTHDSYSLACEMMGRRDGFNCGMGGSQHIKTGNYITNGVTGGMASVACGIAMSLKKKEKDGIVIAFIGDGGFQEGYFWETLNLASIYQLPIVYVLENNHYAMSTRTADFCGGSIGKRVEAVGIDYFYTDLSSIDKIQKTISSAFRYIHDNYKPIFIEVDTFRLCGHSKSDDCSYIPQEEKEFQKSNDPLALLERLIDKAQIEEIKRDVEASVLEAFKKAEMCPEIGIKEYKTMLMERRNGV